ncbi:hypothetical protein V8B97DRAFT_2024968 [Scleroderma yunnanense]
MLGPCSIINPCWKAWALSNPFEFLTLEVLQHCHHMFLDYDLDFQFSLVQTPVGYQAFSKEVSNLKQVTGHDHHSPHCYIIGIFLKAICTLLNFCYLTQSIERVATSLQEFHNHKLELLQSSGVVMQWSVDITQHAHKHADQLVDEDNYFSDSEEDDEHGPDAKKNHFSGLSTLVHQIPDYFIISLALLFGMKLLLPYVFDIHDLHSAVTPFITIPSSYINRLQIWHKVHMQQMSYHNSSILLSLQMLHATSSLIAHPYGQYNSVIISLSLQSNWPRNGLDDFPLSHLDHFLTCVHHSSIVSQSNLANISLVMKWNGRHIGEVILLTHIHLPVHIILNFGHKAHSCLTVSSCYELSNNFWLNKYWMKGIYYTLSLSEL